MIKRIIISLSIFMASCAPNLLKNPSAEHNMDSWFSYGKAGTTIVNSGNTVFYTEDSEDHRSHIFQDALLPSSSEGKYLVLVGSLSVAYVKPYSITRHPYLYGYIFNEKKHILEYLQGQQMRHDCNANCWETRWGIFMIPPTASEVRFFLNQAYQKGDQPDGTQAYYDDLELRVFSTYEKALEFINKYKALHPTVYATE